jgi:alpha-beta hydrolase superfamily lysophospholipase
VSTALNSIAACRKRVVLSVPLLMIFAACPTKAQVPKQAVSGAIHPHARLPLTDFYDTPQPLPAASPGTLIRSEDFQDYTLAPGTSAIRLLYHSRTSSGEDVPVSAVILVPDDNPPPGGWPIIAWAHDFAGIARDCAPSLDQDLGEGSYFSMYAKLGYAVVATDYAGLGTAAPVAFLDLRGNSLDVIYAVAAARSASHLLGSPWITIGAGEGAEVAVAVNEVQSEFGDNKFLGSIAIGGLFDLEKLTTVWAQQAPERIVYLTEAVRANSNTLAMDSILTQQGLRLYQQASRSCDATTLEPSRASALIKPNWNTSAQVQRYLQNNELGHRRASAPLLAIAGSSDSALPVAMTDQVVKRLCSTGDHVLYYKIASPNSKALIGDSVNDQLAWIRARFSHRQAPSNCD